MTHPTHETPDISHGMVLLLAVASGLIVANLYYAQTLVGPISQATGLSAQAAGLIVTLTQIGYCLGLLFIVPLGDLLENRRLIVSALLFTAVALLVAAFSTSAWLFLAAALAIGLGSVAAQVLVPFAAHLSRGHARPDRRQGRQRAADGDYAGAPGGQPGGRAFELACGVRRRGRHHSRVDGGPARQAAAARADGADGLSKADSIIVDAVREHAGAASPRRLSRRLVRFLQPVLDRHADDAGVARVPLVADRHRHLRAGGHGWRGVIAGGRTAGRRRPHADGDGRRAGAGRGRLRAAADCARFAQRRAGAAGDRVDRAGYGRGRQPGAGPARHLQPRRRSAQPLERHLLRAVLRRRRARLRVGRLGVCELRLARRAADRHGVSGTGAAVLGQRIARIEPRRCARSLTDGARRAVHDPAI